MARTPGSGGTPLVVTDFNLFPYSGFNPYFGLGVGPGFGYEKSEFADTGEWTQALVLSPRAGVELFECLRISVHYQWYLSKASTFSHIGFGISWAFNTGGGGRPKKEAGLPATVVSAETMLGVIETLGIVPFFENPIPGYSIEEMTARENWFDGQEDLRKTPWDWKIPVVQSGDVAYGKFLWGGKAAFATVEWYAELMNWRRSLEKYQPTADQREHGSIGIKEIRALLGVKKSAADALMTRLQMQCRVVTGDITRVYRGPDLHYNGWQVSSFCTPESLFCVDAIPGPGGFPFGEARTLDVDHSPAESLARLTRHIRTLAPTATEKQILKMLQ